MICALRSFSRTRPVDCHFGRRVGNSYNSGVAAAAAANSSANGDIPGPKFLELLQTISNLRDGSTLLKMRNNHGDIVRLWAGQSIVFIFDPELYMQVLRQEWSLPHGAAPETWPMQQYYTAKSPETMPMMLLKGEAWKTPRHNLQKHVFNQKVADEYQPGLTQVSNDAVEAIHSLNPEDLNQFLIHVSFEMLSEALLKRRMGLIDHSSSELEKDFVENAVQAFHNLGPLITMPPLPRAILLKTSKTYKTFDAAMDRIWNVGMIFLEEAENDPNSKWEGSMFERLTHDGAMGRQERLVNLITLLQAGVDTTSNSLEFILYQLAKHPAEQERVRQELQRVIPQDGGYKREHLSNLPYFKAFLREVHRMTPTAAGTMRRLPFDVTVGDYHVDKNSLLFFQGEPYNLDAELLGSDPSVFDPDRWVASEQVPKDADPRQPVPMLLCDDDGTTKKEVVAPAPILSHPLVATPFGVGPRMCVGARLAQNEIHTFISAVCLNFRMTLDPPGQEIRSVSKLVMTPHPSPLIRFDPL